MLIKIQVNKVKVPKYSDLPVHSALKFSAVLGVVSAFNYKNKEVK